MECRNILFESYGWKWDQKPIYAYQSYYANYLKVGSYDIRLQPFYLVYGGYILSGFLNDAGSPGNYWSSTAYIINGAYYLLFNSSGVYPSSNYYRYYGFSIRCLAR